jgi:hypothetical protein
MCDKHETKDPNCRTCNELDLFNASGVTVVVTEDGEIRFYLPAL